MALVLAAGPARAAFPGENGKIAFTSNRDDGNFEVYVMDSDGQNQINLTNNEAFDDTPDWGVAPQCTITGTEGADVLAGTSEDDVICGLGGNDIIYDFSGDNDTFVGGEGVDIILGYTGDTTLLGGGGDDFLIEFDGKSANDTLNGEGGNDFCLADQGDTRRNCES